MNRRLGRKNSRKVGSKCVALDLTTHLLPDLLPVPDDIDLLTPMPANWLGHNDAVGDCGVVGVANGLSVEATREGRKVAFADLPDLDDKIRDFYFQYTGGLDTGIDMLEFMYWVRARGNGYLGERIGEPIALNPSDWAQVTTALYYGFGIYFGGNVTKDCCSSAGGSFWRVDDGRDQTLAGGHCMYCTGAKKAGSFNEPNLSLLSWGMPFYTTWSWWKSHIDEAYILVDLARPSTCFNLDVLREDIAKLKGI